MAVAVLCIFAIFALVSSASVYSTEAKKESPETSFEIVSETKDNTTSDVADVFYESETEATSELFSEEDTTKEETTAQSETTTKKETTTKRETTTHKETTTKANSATNNQATSRTVYYTKSGECYHYENPCGNGKYYPCTLQEAKAKGLRPCEKCVLH